MNAPFSNTSRAIAISTAIIGGVVLLGVGATAAISIVAGSERSGSEPTSRSIDVTGISEVTVESNSSEFTLQFGDVTEATLDTNGAGRFKWELYVEEGELVAETKTRIWDFCFGWCSSRNEQVTLTLPESMNNGSLDADIEVASGSLTARGTYRDLSLRTSAGVLDFDGAAESIDAEIGAGRLTVRVEDANEVDFEVSAGRLDAEVIGQTPRQVDLEVSAGRAEVRLPQGDYDVRSEVSAGSLDNQLDTSARSNNKISVSVSAGSALLGYAATR